MTPTRDGPTEHGAERIAVLLVDDNEQWATFLRDDLEREEASLDVSIALSANEAMLSLANESIDVVVADYRMPEIDGLQLLERIREDRPMMPFILVTGAGSEEVAATAIEAGVTDYLVKNPNTDQTPLLARRIRAAFEQFRLRERLRESESRYRTVAERSHDAIGIIKAGRLIYHNQRLATLTGRDSADLDGIDFVETVIHEADRERVTERLTAETDDNLLEARLVTERGDVRDGEFAWATIDHEDGRAILVSIRDVTRRKRREERIERERSLNRGIFDALVESATRTEIETFVTGEFVEHGYDLAWVGEPADEGVTPRVHGGTGDYLEELKSGSVISAPGEPAVVAERTGDPTFIDDITTLLESNWREAASAAGFRSVASLPLSYDGVNYGVLAVYHRSPAQFDDIERELLTEAARTLAFVVHHVETLRSLGGESPVAVELSVGASSSPISSALAAPTLDTGSVKATILGTHAGTDSRTVQYLAVSGAPLETVAEELRDTDGVTDVLTIERGDSSHLQLTSTERPIESVLISRGARVVESQVTPDGLRITFELGNRTALGDVVSEVEERFGTTDIESITEAEPPQTESIHSVDLDALTAKQVAALEAARQHGYFEQPRVASATEIAEALGVSHSTYLQHLRAAQRKLTEQLFSDSGISE